MMMAYGMFIFMLDTAAYQALQQETSWRHVKNDRIGKSAKWQYIGTGEDTITLTGTLYPEVTGGDVSLTTLRTIAYGGRPWPLVEGTGVIYGMFVIAGITENRTEFMNDGKAQKIEFTLTLKKVSEDIREKLAGITADDILSLI
ncbi:phage tail protein [Erwinia persicina]|uniref:phage tail protein n=1 Tax=Erwinia persicina TaxID=55211 RepID=UPI0017805C77|nr:phage tail protein [Erwinia persicina]MBD8169522.1 phage tail protein [Erwinia persicina]